MDFGQNLDSKSDDQVCKYTSMHIYASMQVCTYACMHIYASMQVYKYVGMQVLKYASMEEDIWFGNKEED